MLVKPLSLDYAKLADRIQTEAAGEWTNERLMILTGSLGNQGKDTPKDGKRSRYNYVRYKYLLNSPVKLGANCCNVMKKNPAHQYYKQTGLKPYIATMASESFLRTQKWMQNGCNVYDGGNPASMPISFWTEQDVLMYLYLNDLPIAKVYGEIVPDRPVDKKDLLSSLGIFEKERPSFDTTGVDRTGCMFCLFGIFSDKSPNRLERMKITHPKQYEYIMKPVENGGLGYKEFIDWVNENDGKRKIDY